MDQVVNQLVEQVQALQAQLALRKPMVLASAVGGLPESQHLDGTNYSEWKFAMKNYLVDAGLWHCVENENVDHELDQRALAKINLSIKPCASGDVRKAMTAKQAWEKLRCAYEDNGLVRRIGLYSSLFKTRFEECGSMTAYIDRITGIADQLESIGKPLDNETVGDIILGGLPIEFQPLILGIQGSYQKITVEFVKGLLLQNNAQQLVSPLPKDENCAFVSQSAKEKVKERCNRRCLKCKQTGHILAKCPFVLNDRRPSKNQKKSDKHLAASTNFAASCLLIQKATDGDKDWFLDSGATTHLTHRDDWMEEYNGRTTRTVAIANGTNITTKGCGVVKIPLATEKTMVAHDVRHAPELAMNLLSVSRIAAQKKTLIFDENGCRIVDLAIEVLRQHMLGTATQSKEVLELVHSDICGPMQVTSVGGARYFLSFIDDFSRKSFVYFLKHKNEALPKFKDFIAVVERQTSKRVKCLRTDNGREYVNNMFAEFLMRKGIRHERTIPETPQQNGVAERMNRTLVEKARTMLIDANLSPDLWAEAVGTANYLRNRCPTKALRKVTPEEAWSGRKPNLAHLKIFGCLAMVHVASGQRKKWDPKSEERIFVGYCETSKGYRTVDRKTKKMYVTRDVKFLESRFPGTQSSKEESTNSLMNPDVGEEAVIVWTSQDSGSTEMNPNPSVPPKVDTDSNESTGQSPQPSVKTSPEELRRPLRNRFPNRNIFNADFLLFQTQVREQSDPISYEEALNRPDAKEWLKAINEELASHHENQSWETAVLPPNKKAIKSKWVFKTKYKVDGTIEKRKARLVARGYPQRQGIDYEDTFAPTLGYSSLRYLLSLAAKYNLEVD
ncbi:Retrovirus-related Pol polyprotein from transposon TNT 1-94 [Trichinella sp. T9]|nr:Retrovirus-related Pol polyprotein from transposon TNT 1-94 [Trichinella sp. T9]